MTYDTRARADISVEVLSAGINRIINGGMAVDQRNSGASQTIVAGAALAYTVDRWYAYCVGANVSGQRVAGSGNTQYVYQFTGASGVSSIGFGQRIETINSYDLQDRVVTLSVKLSNSLLTTVTWSAYYADTEDTFGSLASPTKTLIDTGTFTVDGTLSKYSTQINIPTEASTGLEILFTVGEQTSGTWEISEVQLEAGTVNSEFVSRPQSQELLLCSRYFLELGKGENNYLPLFFASMYSSTAGTWVMYLPCNMRSIPTVTFTGNLYAQNASARSISAINGPYSHINNILEGDIVLSGSATVNTVSVIRWNNVSIGSRSFRLNAEM